MYARYILTAQLTDTDKSFPSNSSSMAPSKFTNAAVYDVPEDSTDLLRQERQQYH